MVILCTAFTSVGQILWKIGAGKIAELSVIALLTNWALLLGFVSYGIGAVLLVLALRNGELSVLYPIVATSYVWVSLLSMKFLGETMNAWKWSGVAVILAGVVLVQLPGVVTGEKHGN